MSRCARQNIGRITRRMLLSAAGPQRPRRPSPKNAGSARRRMKKARWSGWITTRWSSMPPMTSSSTHR
jgi:hypothetical protein